MKNFILAFAAIVSLTVISCREADEIANFEDASTLQKISNDRTSRGGDSIQVNSAANAADQLDGEIVQPPRR